MSKDKKGLIESTAIAVKELVPETTRQTDGILSTVVGFFNNVVLYPVKKANLTFKYKLEAFEQDLKKKIENIPSENLQDPPLMIAGPVLEALKYTYDEENLREMYENLLASAMDNRKVNSTHPSYVDAIKQMSPLDAKILAIIVEKRQLRCGEIVFDVQKTGKIIYNGMPKYFVPELVNLSDPFIVSSALSNIERLKLIDISDTRFNNMNYEEIKNHSYVIERASYFKEMCQDFTVQLIDHGIAINNYGQSFARACMNKGVI